MPYAEGTTVTVESSRGEITGILTKHGVQRMGWQTGPEQDELLFELKGNHYRFAIRKPTLHDIRRLYPNTRDENAKLNAEWRRRWRAQVLLIKAKLEFADGDTTTVEREFVSNLLVDGHQTIGDILDTQGVQGLLLLGEGS